MSSRITVLFLTRPSDHHAAQDTHHWTHAAQETGHVLRVLLGEFRQLVGDVFYRRPSR